MTNKTKDLIIDKLDYDASKISVCNPIISRKIKQLSFEKINQPDEIIFKKSNYFCRRLTRQKNYLLLLEAFNKKDIRKL